MVQFAASSKAADAPELPDGPGLYDARFEGVEEGNIEGNSKYPNSSDEVFIWKFTLLDEDGEPVYDQGEPLEVEGITSRSTNTKSKTTPRAVRYLKSIMTSAEYKAFEAEEPVDAEALVGRQVQVQVVLKDSGWPKVDDVIAARKARSK